MTKKKKKSKNKEEIKCLEEKTEKYITFSV